MAEIIKIKDTEIWIGDCLESMRQMPDGSVNCVVSSPPYLWLRDYGTNPIEWPEVSFSPMPGLPEITIQPVKCDLGLEPDIWSFIGHIVLIFREAYRVLKKDGTLWLNIGDSYAHNRTGGNGATGGLDKSTLSSSMPPTGTTPIKKPMPADLKEKDMVGIPWRVALALQADGWYLRQDIIWHKPNPMPESCRDRCTKAHEYIFLLSKSARYFYDQDAIREAVGPKGNANGFRGGAYCNGNTDNATLGKRTQTGNQKIPGGWQVGPGSHGNFHEDGRGGSAYSFARNTATQGAPGQPDQHRRDREPKFYQGSRNKRSVWTVATYPYKGAHFATFPPALIEPCILAGCPRSGTVLDPFGGSGTTAYVANGYGRKAILCELNPSNLPLIKERLGCGYEPVEMESYGQGDLFPEMEDA